MLDNCLEHGKIETPKCVDLDSKSAINSICFRVQLQATNRQFWQAFSDSRYRVNNTLPI
jgi:hypothetical protein